MSPNQQTKGYFFEGKRFGLRPLQAADADGPYSEWFNDAVVCRHNSHHVYPYTREHALKYIEYARSTQTAIILAIEDLESRRHVGNVALQNIDLIGRSAEFAIVIGERDFWGQGVGLEVGRIVLAHGFDSLGLYRVGCGTSEENEAMRKLAIALGMREEGRRRAAMWKGGRFVDVIEYGVLANEFRVSSQLNRPE